MTVTCAKGINWENQSSSEKKVIELKEEILKSLKSLEKKISTKESDICVKEEYSKALSSASVECTIPVEYFTDNLWMIMSLGRVRLSITWNLPIENINVRLLTTDEFNDSYSRFFGDSFSFVVFARDVDKKTLLKLWEKLSNNLDNKIGK